MDNFLRYIVVSSNVILKDRNKLSKYIRQFYGQQLMRFFAIYRPFLTTQHNRFYQ